MEKRQFIIERKKKEFKENETIADFFQGERVTLSYDTLSKIGKRHFIITSKKLLINGGSLRQKIFLKTQPNLICENAIGNTP